MTAPLPVARSYIHPSGNPHNHKLIVVGLQPNLQEVRNGKGFNDTCLDDFLSAGGLVRGECLLTYLFPTLDYHMSRYVNASRAGTHFTEMGLPWGNYLASLIAASPSPFIVALGGTVTALLTGREGIQKWRGSVVECSLVQGKWVFPIYGIEDCLPPKGTFLNKYLTTLDCRRHAPVWKAQAYSPFEYRTHLRPSYLEALGFLDSALAELPDTDQLIAFDIEVYNEEVSCISFARHLNSAISIAFVDAQGDVFNPDQELVIWQKIAQLLEDDRIKKLGQNLTFDTHFLLRRYGIRTANLEDTMIAQQVTMPDFPKGLDFITSLHTPFPYYKDEGKTWFRQGGAMENLWHYNCLDSLACLHAWPKLWEELERQGNVDTYRRQCGIVPPLVYMMERGIRVDLPGILSERKRLLEENEQLQVQLEELAGRPLNPNSPKQLQDFFYTHKGFAPYKSKLTGNIAVDADALKRLSRKGSREAQIILAIRKNAKIANTYLVPEKFDKEPDGSHRIRCSYNPVGTRYSRLSSSANIFGTGMNLQNWPHRTIKYLMADKGYIGYAFDLSQAENRIVAYSGCEEAMIEAFEKELDVHSLTAALIFNKKPEEVTTEDGTCSLGTGEHSERFWGKKCVAGETEVLTPFGWQRIDEWDWEHTALAQWEPSSRTISFVMATNMSSYMSDVIELSGRHIHLIGTPNHRVPLYRKDKDLFKVETLAELDMQSRYGIPLSGEFTHDLSLYTHDEVRLMVAFQADGSHNGKSHRFKFSKRRKIERIEDILTTLGISYRKTFQGDGSTLIGFRGPEWLTKHFSAELLLLGLPQMKTFMEELHHWDGHKTGTSVQYFSTCLEDVHWAQTIAHLAGYVALIEERPPKGISVKPLHIMHYNKRTAHAIISSLCKEALSEQTMVYGPEVPSGFFLIRSRGKVSVTGNSNHGLNYDLGFRSFALYYEMPEKDAKFIVERYHRAYPGVRGIFHKMVRDQLWESRTITNLMGRRTVFLDKLVDATFKEAYSCIPQGTVGDIINERGLIFIYREIPEAELLSQTHDEVVFQLPESLSLEKHAEILLRVKASLEVPLSVHGRTFTIPADLTVFRRFKEGQDIKGSRFPREVPALVERLSAIIGGLHA